MRFPEYVNRLCEAFLVRQILENVLNTVIKMPVYGNVNVRRKTDMGYTMNMREFVCRIRLDFIIGWPSLTEHILMTATSGNESAGLKLREAKAYIG